MLRTDFSNQPYIAEVLQTSSVGADRAPTAIEQLIDGRWNESRLDTDAGEITIYHGLVVSPTPFHRTRRTILDEKGKEIEIPRTKLIRKRDHYLYDLLVLRRRNHLILAVPFHGLANNIFLKVDKLLAGTRTLYETLNITNMVIRLGAKGRTGPNAETEIVVTRCHLNYSDPAERRRDLDQVRLTGSNLGASDIYSELIKPVLRPKELPQIVTPVLLGFALIQDGVRKSSATTDRHGNFKVTVGPGLRLVTRLFQLLDEIEGMHNVVSTTSNVPILQSGAIEGAD